MAPKRYQLQKEGDDTWSVIDGISGRPAERGQGLATGLTLEDADSLVDLLNEIDRPYRVKPTAMDD